ncbi:hypothetical protein J7E25_13655 [Agromyces sp. ISL-38]|uniref:hypothetical protein n=1 Tax=Agromyces sp. ISL-38 TaxID=2819107 RepID=UPI001BE8C19C|nr:hypothetical protein [Agromyces sp. ISL-38]MBT2500133.1 hypothetical protein [Agromyces sp. ISL-38]MBT2516800.1 hypothetical protein [Streptomyces sp. ISL-90]
MDTSTAQPAVVSDVERGHGPDAAASVTASDAAAARATDAASATDDEVSGVPR